jgi:hypothetical protein
LNKEAIQDGLEFFNSSRKNTFGIRLNISESFMFKSRPQSIDEREEYPSCEYFREATLRYQSIKIKRFDVEGVETVSAESEKIDNSDKGIIKDLNSCISRQIDHYDNLKEKLKKVELERDEALCALSKKSDELLQLRDERSGKGNSKSCMVDLCEIDDSSSSSCTIQTFFQLFIFFLTLMKIYITIDVMGDPSRIRLKKEPYRSKPGNNTDEDLDC